MAGCGMNWDAIFYSIKAIAVFQYCYVSFAGPGSIDLGGKTSYRIMFLGSSQSGKTSIIRQFLYDKFSHFHTETMDDMYRGEFEDLSGNIITFDIQDVGGNYVYEFPSMRSVSMKSADAFVLVFSLDDSKSWEEVYKLRDMIIDAKVTFN